MKARHDSMFEDEKDAAERVEVAKLAFEAARSELGSKTEHVNSSNKRQNTALEGASSQDIA